MLPGPGYFGYKGQPVEMATAVAGGIALLFFVNLSRFKSFKGCGVEAELIEAVKDAQVTLEKMHELVRPLVVFWIQQLAWGNRIGQMPGREVALGTAMGIAKAFGVPADTEEIGQALGMYYRHEAWDGFQRFTSHVRLQDKELAASEALSEFEQRKTVAFPSEAQLRVVLAVLARPQSQEAEALLQAFLRYVSANGAMARSDP